MKLKKFSLANLDHQLAARALNHLKSDGKSFDIVGANVFYEGKYKGGLDLNDKTFLNFLYTYFSVYDNYVLEGNLYARQGTTFPIRLIL